jgi:hypothetical protein
MTPQDYDSLKSRWITPELAQAAGLKRVPDHEGRQLIGHKSLNCAGLLIPYRLPGESRILSHRIRRDHPEMENGKPKSKYLSEPGARNRLYFPAGVTPEMLADVSIPIVITEGEFKTIALWRLATEDRLIPLFLPIGLSGVWNWKGVIGKTADHKGTRVPEKGVIPDLARITWSGRRATIAFDADIDRKTEVKVARALLSRELRTRGSEVGFLEWEEGKGKGIDDWLANEGPTPVMAAFDAVDFNRTTGWRANLRVGAPKKDGTPGKPLPILLNADIALRTCPDWEGVFAFDEFRQKVRIVAEGPIDGAIPRDWADTDDTRTSIWMQQKGINLGRDIVGQAVQSVAADYTVHPLRDWLDSLRWDGVPRLDTWLSEYLGAKPSSFIGAMGSMWLISAVARVYVPGCKVDHMLVLEGPQGIGKSRALRILAGDEYFCDSMPDIHSKDASLQTFGAWVIEWAELDAMNRAEATGVKDFITRQFEELRLPYGKRTVKVPRQCVFAGTTNTDGYLKDETGNRRFWPVVCGQIDFNRLAEDRDQIWAEAVARYKGGERWWPEGADLIADLAAEQSARVEVDPWQSEIDSYVVARGSVRAEDVLVHLGIEKQNWDRIKRLRVGRCLRAAGFKVSRSRSMGRCFVKGEE